MEERLKEKSIFFSLETGVLFGLFFALRLTSFFLMNHLILQGVLVIALIILLAALYFDNPTLAWYLVLGEVFLGGSGHFFEFLGLSLRTLLVITMIMLTVLHSFNVERRRARTPLPKTFILFLTLFWGYLLFSMGLGVANDHGIRAVVQDAIPFIFLFLFFPFSHVAEYEELRERIARLALVSAIANGIWVLILFFYFNSGLGAIHDLFYTWFRDVNMGKITDLGQGFFRIVEPSHLLLVPSILFVSSLLMRNERHHPMWRIALGSLLLTLAIDISRTYMLALGVGFVILLYKHKLFRWIKVGGVVVGLFLLFFGTLSFVASRGETMGLELLGLRIASVTRPDIEESSANRMTLLPPIFYTIRHHPLLGVGPGASITYLNQKAGIEETTRQFDWGYFEMVAELGLLGATLYLFFWLYAILLLSQHIRQLRDYHDFHVGLLAGVIAFLVMTITAPALFHVYGILFLVFVTAIGIEENSRFDEIVTVLYRIFNRLKKI